jgi:hypothetical protein
VPAKVGLTLRLLRTPADESIDPAFVGANPHEGIKSIATNHTRIVHAISILLPCRTPKDDDDDAKTATKARDA